MAPALLADVPDAAAGLASEEVFGPVAAVFRFTDPAEAITRANRRERVWPRMSGHATSRSAGVRPSSSRAGIVGVNNALPTVAFAPMGGVKQSGLGREGASIGLEKFEDVRYLALGL